MARDREAEKIIFNMVHKIESSARLMAEVYQYHRCHKDCPGGTKFYEAIKQLNASTLEGLAFIKKRNDE